MMEIDFRNIEIVHIRPVRLKLQLLQECTEKPMSKRMGGAEKANDLLSSKSCLKDVVVGMSSSKNVGLWGYLRAGWLAKIVIIRSSYELSSPL